MDQKCLIIAEVGVNHNGDTDIAKKLVEAACDAGADLVKFQTFTADRLVTAQASMAEYQVLNIGESITQYEMLRRLELSSKQHTEIATHCKSIGIEFFSTAFDTRGLDYLKKFGMQRFKVASGEITNFPYLVRVASFGRPVILSTGMCNLGEIEAAIHVLESNGLERRLVTVLHCNTAYPTPVGDVNLRAMLSIRQAFGVEVGYSDHTTGIEIAIAAAALGAKVIEKHLTIDREMIGPDHRASLTPREFSIMVKSIRNVESAIGDGVKRVSQSESHNIIAARKSIVALRDIRIGEVLTVEIVGTKRPAGGLSPMRWKEVIGTTAKKPYKKDEFIEI